MIPDNYMEKLYAGWLGKLIGVRFGAPSEGWSYEQIEKTYGEVEDYLVDYREFAADDDSNGPMFFLRALEDYGLNATAEEMGLNPSTAKTRLRRGREKLKEHLRKAGFCVEEAEDLKPDERVSGSGE